MLKLTMPALMSSRRAVLLTRLAGVAALAGFLGSGAAYAQMPNVNIIPEIEHKTPEQKEQDLITEKAYKDSLRKIPDAKVSSDPWGGVRSAETPRTSTKPKNRTGNAAQ